VTQKELKPEVNSQKYFNDMKCLRSDSRQEERTHGGWTYKKLAKRKL